MCLLVLAWQVHPRFPLIVAANRDELHVRPTLPLSRWSEPPGILGGRDLRAGGTWLAASAGALIPRAPGAPQQLPHPGPAFGAITNFREPKPAAPGATSRGALIPRFMASGESPETFLHSIEPDAHRFAGFNLLLSRGRELWYASNRAATFARPLSAGIYGLSNHTLDTPWPKLERIRADFAGYLRANPDTPDPDALLDLLDQREAPPPDASFEDVLGAPFVVHPVFGTRSSTIVRVNRAGAIFLTERRFDAEGRATGQTSLASTASGADAA